MHELPLPFAACHVREYVDRFAFVTHARQLVSNAKKNADQIVSQAKTQAEQLLAEVKADSERRQAAAQREVDELTRQQDSIASHLAQVRQLMGGQLPGMDSAASKGENSTRTALRPSATNSGKHSKRQDHDEDWWGCGSCCGTPRAPRCWCWPRCGRSTGTA